MVTLRESAEKLVNEAFPCYHMQDCWTPKDGQVVDSDDCHDTECDAFWRTEALSAVLKGMRLVVERDAAIANGHHTEEFCTERCEYAGEKESCPGQIVEAIRAQLQELEDK